jgi:signal transduction histidine kinase
MDRLLQAESLRKEAVEPKWERLDLRLALSEITARFNHEAKSKGLALVLEVPKGAEARTDRELVTLVMQNLLGNAIKYSAHGTVRITAKAMGGETGWMVEVSDEGPGIAPQNLSRLF